MVKLSPVNLYTDHYLIFVIVVNDGADDINSLDRSCIFTYPASVIRYTDFTFIIAFKEPFQLPFLP